MSLPKGGLKFIWGGALLMVVLATSILVAPSSANAVAGRADGYGYFDNQAGFSSGWHNMFPGGIPNSTDKATFIGFILGKLGGGTAQEQTAAAFIINLQLGLNGPGVGRSPSAANISDWQDRINNPAVSLSLENYTFTENSAWADSINDALFYAQSGTRYSLVFYYSGAKVSVVKQDCGNPLDGLSGLPPYNPGWSLSSAAWADQGSALPGQVITFHFRIHNNGPAAADFQYVDRFQTYTGNSPDPVWSWPTPNYVVNGFPAGWDTSAYNGAGIAIPNNYPGNLYCAWTEYAGQSNSNGNPAASNHVCVTINHPAPACNGYTLAPSSGLDPTTPFVLTPSVKYQDQPATNAVYGAGGRLFATVVGPGYNKDFTLDWGPPAAADLTVAQLFPATGQTGTYTITYGVRGSAIPSGNITCGGTPGTSFQVGLYPYFRIEGGDIAAGAGFGTACTLDPSAAIKGWNKGTAGGYFGAGAQLAAIALNSLVGFPTSTNNDGTTSGVASPNPAARTGLSFSNNAAPTGSYVGLPCMPDYAATAAGTVGAVPLPSTDLGTIAPGTVATYTVNGNVTLTGGILGANTHVTIVVLNGDVTIASDIKYGAYASIATAPQFQLLVQNGSIRIAPTVGELHGVYDAQSGATAGSGTVSTCWNGSDTADYVTCKQKQLIVYGAVTAKVLLLERTWGNLNAFGGTPNTPSEIFQYTPELWAAYSNKTGNGAQTFDSVTSLPPIL